MVQRFRLTDHQRRRLAIRGKAIGRRALVEVASIVTPDTILRWHRRLIAQKWTHSRRSMGRPRNMQVIAELAVRMATRRIEIAGITPSPNEAWMMRVGRNLTDPVDGFLAQKELVILDRDSKFTAGFRHMLKNAGVG